MIGSLIMTMIEDMDEKISEIKSSDFEPIHVDEENQRLPSIEDHKLRNLLPKDSMLNIKELVNNLDNKDRASFHGDAMIQLNENWDRLISVRMNLDLNSVCVFW